MTTIMDYGVGNVMAFANYYRRAGIEARVARTADELADARRIILPGVGSFDHAIRELDRSGMRPVLEALVGKGVPVLGVCVGMQMLVDGSDEGTERGLGWIRGRVHRFPATHPDTGAPLPLPHMGWNDVRPTAPGGLFAGIEDDARFYFLHSYYVEPAEDGVVAALTEYGGARCCAVASGHVYGVQFHPEKSHRWGGAVLSNFARI